MTEMSARFRLPFIIPGQAQKEVYHNEALNLIDCALHPNIEEGPVNEPPASPLEGQSWVIGVAPIGDWNGKGGMLATWTQGGWRFSVPLPGMLVWKKSLGLWIHWTGASWSEGELPASCILVNGQQVLGPRLPPILSPSEGTIIDAEARAAIEAVIAALKSHGLTD